MKIIIQKLAKKAVQDLSLRSSVGLSFWRLQSVRRRFPAQAQVKRCYTKTQMCSIASPTEGRKAIPRTSSLLYERSNGADEGTKSGTKNLSLFLILSVLFTGCSTVPFESEPKGDFQGLEPDAVVADFAAVVGTEFELLESVVFKFFTKGFTGLGYLSIEPESEAYALTCMTPMGVSIFGLKGEGETVEPLFVPPQMEKHQDKTFAAIGTDLRRIYLNGLPPADAQVKVKKDRMIFESGGVEWVFSGASRYLTEKRFSRGWKTEAIATYYNYEEMYGKLYPTGVVLYNKRFHYKMIFRVKEIYPPRASE